MSFFAPRVRRTCVCMWMCLCTLIFYSMFSLSPRLPLPRPVYLVPVLVWQVFLLTSGFLDDGSIVGRTARNIISGMICGRRFFFTFFFFFVIIVVGGSFFVVRFALNWSSASHNFISGTQTTTMWLVLVARKMKWKKWTREYCLKGAYIARTAGAGAFAFIRARVTAAHRTEERSGGWVEDERKAREPSHPSDTGRA